MKNKTMKYAVTLVVGFLALGFVAVSCERDSKELLVKYCIEDYRVAGNLTAENVKLCESAYGVK